MLHLNFTSPFSEQPLISVPTDVSNVREKVWVFYWHLDTVEATKHFIYILISHDFWHVIVYDNIKYIPKWSEKNEE